MTTYWCENAWLGGDAPVAGVAVEETAGLVTAVQQAATPPPGAVRLAGLVLPGFANAHSHAFHRALRGRTHAGGGTFWTWREQMYAVADRLTPETYLALATAAYSEMVLAGVTCVGEFHYLHHDVGGKPYAAATLMSDVLVEAASAAGLRITLLDTCYLAGGIGRPLEGPQLRFGDGDAQGWAERFVHFTPVGDHARTGAAIHSVRAVPADQLPTVVDAVGGRPLHVHLSEQPAENDACLEAYGCTPTGLLAECAALGPGTTAVHATHLTADDLRLLGGTRTTACLCPTTERDLADGIGPARALADAGSPLSLGTDSHAVVDLLEETRAVELDERLASRRRGHWPAAELLRMATEAGHACLGWPEAGRIEVGAPCDLVALTLDSVRTAGGGPLLETAVFAATAADVREVVIGGRHVVSEGRHRFVDVPRALTAAIAAVTA